MTFSKISVVILAVATVNAVAIADTVTLAPPEGVTTNVLSLFTGDTAVEVAGPGIVKLNNSNLHAGGTTLSGGTLVISGNIPAGGPLPVGTGTFTVSGGTLRDAGTFGGDVKDMADSVDWIGKGYLHPEVMITHVGGLDSAAQATLDMLKVPGGKRLVYTHVNLPMTAIADFAEKGKTDPFFAELDRLCSANNGLWCKEAEEYLLAHAPKVEIGAPKELVKERIIRLGA